MGAEMASREELLELLHAAIDGVDGYVCECGYLRYWNEQNIARALRHELDISSRNCRGVERAAQILCVNSAPKNWLSGTFRPARCCTAVWGGIMRRKSDALRSTLGARRKHGCAKFLTRR